MRVTPNQRPVRNRRKVFTGFTLTQLPAQKPSNVEIHASRVSPNRLSTAFGSFVFRLYQIYPKLATIFNARRSTARRSRSPDHKRDKWGRWGLRMSGVSCQRSVSPQTADNTIHTEWVSMILELCCHSFHSCHIQRCYQLVYTNQVHRTACLARKGIEHEY